MGTTHGVFRTGAWRRRLVATLAFRLAVDRDGSRATYAAGAFFAEAPGHIHTVQVAQGAEVFVLQFLPPGAEATVPVQ